MPRLTNLDDDILRGIIFGFHLLDHNSLLQNLTFREFIINFGFDEQIHNELNTRFGLNNQFFHAEYPQWARYHYPEPNQDKYILVTCANQTIRFRWPGYISGEEEHNVRIELKSLEDMSERYFKQVNWERDGLIKQEIAEKKARMEEKHEELSS